MQIFFEEVYFGDLKQHSVMTRISYSHLFPTGYSYYFVVVEICIEGEILLLCRTLLASFDDMSFLV